MKELIQLPACDEAQRLFHGRGHYYPGYEHINIDWFKPIVFITLYREVDEGQLNNIANYLYSNIEACSTILAQFRCREKAPIVKLLGEDVKTTVAIENKLKYQLDFNRNQNFGLFVDIKNTRQWVKNNCQNKRVLNLFSYTCAFSVAAIEGGANFVLNLDMSKSALAKGRENHKLNQHDLSKVRFEGVDLFKSFGRVKRHGPYDLVICDPPAFQKGSVDIKRDYKKIIRRLPQFSKDGADILLCLNSPDLDEDFLHNTVKEECPECLFIQDIKAPEVFKEAIAGKGLKVLLYRFTAKQSQ